MLVVIDEPFVFADHIFNITSTSACGLSIKLLLLYCSSTVFLLLSITFASFALTVCLCLLDWPPNSSRRTHQVSLCLEQGYIVPRASMLLSLRLSNPRHTERPDSQPVINGDGLHHLQNPNSDCLHTPDLGRLLAIDLVMIPSRHLVPRTLPNPSSEFILPIKTSNPIMAETEEMAGGRTVQHALYSG
eukprot:scaffold212_cov108-Skeletonema_dohrnii-CCMP3373.AAC.7